MTTPRSRAESTTVTMVDSSGTSITVILASCWLVPNGPNHITWVFDGLSRNRLAFIQSLMSAMHALRRTGDDGSGVVGWSGDITWLSSAYMCTVQPELMMSDIWNSSAVWYTGPYTSTHCLESLAERPKFHDNRLDELKRHRQWSTASPIGPTSGSDKRLPLSTVISDVCGRYCAVPV